MTLAATIQRYRELLHECNELTISGNLLEELGQVLDAAARTHAAELEREDRIDLDVAKRTVMIRAQLAQAVEAGNFVCGEMEHAIFELRCAFSMKETDTMTLRQLASAAKGAIEQGKADREERNKMGASLITAGAGVVGAIGNALQDRIAKLRDALRMYGGHVHDCPSTLFIDPKPCTCGFKAAWDEWVEGKA